MRTVVGQTIDFSENGNARNAMLYGWSQQEPHHTWCVGFESALRLDMPEAPNGYYLELYWIAWLRQPWLSAQPVTINVNGIRVFTGDAASSELVAVRCPPPRPTDQQLLVEFIHPNATRPADFGLGDQRLLAVGLRRLRILPIIETEKECHRRRSHIKLTGNTVPALAAESATLTGGPIADVLLAFEMLSGNCDMGVVQRVFELEPLSLLRFAGSYAAVSIKGLDTGFEGIGHDLEPWDGNGEWMIRDAYGLNYHSMQGTSDVSQERLLVMERRRIEFLRRKFLDDLSAGEKIFVADRNVGPVLHAVLPLFLALTRHGPRNLLWVVTTESEGDSGAVQEVMPGLFIGYLSRFRPPMAGHISIPSWLEILLNAWLLIKEPAHLMQKKK